MSPDINEDLMTNEAFDNRVELRVLGLMRSGNHAIIEWILEQYRDYHTVFLNNVRHGPHDPFQTADRILLDGSPITGNQDHCYHRKRDLLVYSYEDRLDAPIQSSLVSSALHTGFSNVRERFLGRSKQRFDIAIIRDPLNFFASRLQQFDSRKTGAATISPELIKDRWVDFAEYCLAEETDSATDKIVVTYNKWVTDSTFRLQLSNLLGGKYSDTSLRHTSEFGGGSSFERTRIPWPRLAAKWRRLSSPQAWKSIPGIIKAQLRSSRPGRQTLSRWRLFEGDPRFKVMTNDPRVLELSHEIFGDIYSSTKPASPNG